MKKTITSHLHHQIQSLIHTCIHIHTLPSDTQMDKPFFPASFIEQRQFICTSLACRMRYIPLASLVLRTSDLNCIIPLAFLSLQLIDRIVGLLSLHDDTTK